MKKWWVTMLMMCLDHLGVALVVDVVAVAALKVVAAVLAEIALIMVVRAVCTVYDEVSLSPIWMVGDELPVGVLRSMKRTHRVELGVHFIDRGVANSLEHR